MSAFGDSLGCRRPCTRSQQMQVCPRFDVGHSRPLFLGEHFGRGVWSIVGIRYNQIVYEELDVSINNVIY